MENIYSQEYKGIEITLSLILKGIALLYDVVECFHFRYTNLGCMAPPACFQYV